MDAEKGYDGGGTTGFPSPARDSVERTVDLSDVLCLRRPGRYPMRVSGDALAGRGILDGDILVVDTAAAPTDGCIAVITADGELRIETVAKRGSCWWTAGAVAGKISEASVWGVATGLVRQLA